MSDVKLREALDRTWEALDADESKDTERVPIGVKWLLELNEAVARLRAALAAAQPDKAGGPDGVPEGPWECANCVNCGNPTGSFEANLCADCDRLHTQQKEG